MNTDGLAKLYHTLKPLERLPLIMAASARGDEAERDRLGRSAPLANYRLPDYHGLADAVMDLSLFQATEVLRLGMLQQRLSTIADKWDDLPAGQMDKAEGDRIRGLVRVTAYRVTAEIDGWRAFCRDFHFDPELMLKEMPCYQQMRFAEDDARAAAWTWEEAHAFLGCPGRVVVELSTVEDVAKSLRDFIDERVAWWQ